MWFVIKFSFWFGLVLSAMPGAGDRPDVRLLAHRAAPALMQTAAKACASRMPGCIGGVVAAASILESDGPARNRRERQSVQTLQPYDLKPAWQGRAPRDIGTQTAPF